MSLPLPGFRESFVIHAKDAEVLGWSSVKIRLLADASNAGGALSVMRTTIAPNTEAAKPHTHTRSAEMFYVLDGRAEILTGTRVITAGSGDLIVVPPNEVHAFGTPKSSRAEILIVQAPGLERFGYFRLIERLMKGEATMEQVLATQELYDNHFVESQSGCQASVSSQEQFQVAVVAGDSRAARCSYEYYKSIPEDVQHEG